METTHQNWKISDLLKNIEQIEFPEFQREPTVWKLDKKQRLIDSVLKGFDISSCIFIRERTVDGGNLTNMGRQRINAILSFLGVNGADEDDNGFHLTMENEIYDDDNKFDDINQKKDSGKETS